MTGIYILFSGGYDSSYAIHKVLSNIKNEKSYNKYEINLVSIEGTFSGKKVERESKSRKILYDYWKSKYYDISINWDIIKIDLNNLGINARKTGLTQPLVWIPSVMMSVDFSLYDDIIVIFSYICGDQALSCMDAIKQICYNTIDIIVPDKPFSLDHLTHNKESKDKLSLSFPLKFLYKEDIIENLIKEDCFIFENCTTCENADENDFCGECTPCKVLKSVFQNILNDDRVDHCVKNVVRDRLNNFPSKEKKVEYQLVDTKEE